MTEGWRRGFLAQTPKGELARLERQSRKSAQPNVNGSTSPPFAEAVKEANPLSERDPSAFSAKEVSHDSVEEESRVSASQGRQEAKKVSHN